jgi:hypothetical protein
MALFIYTVSIGPEEIYGFSDWKVYPGKYYPVGYCPTDSDCHPDE